METPIYIALSRQLALRRQLDIVANNIANVSTPAYKAERIVFVEYLAKPARNEKISMVQDIGTARDLREGPLTKTDNPFDLAISGKGYFVIDTPLGERYTRHGRFQLDAQGQLVTSQGYPVLSTGGQPITIPVNAGKVTIAPDGTITVGNSDFFIADSTQIDRIAVVTFNDEQALRRNANNLYSAQGQEPQPVDTPRVVQGMLEESNVQAIIEITRMIEVLRSHQSTARFVQAEHDRAMRAINRLTRRSQAI